MTIRQRADECRASIDVLLAEKEAAATAAQRAVINKRILMLEELEQWFRARAGYK